MPCFSGARPSRAGMPLFIGLAILMALFVLGCGGNSAGPTTTAQTAPPGQDPSGQTSTSGGQPELHPVTGASGLGDPYYPKSGNGGYDVENYDISLDIDPASAAISGQTVITATATQDLAAFYLDFDGLSISGVTLDGGASKFERKGAKLKVTCPQAIAARTPFTVAVTYSGRPKGLANQRGWQKDGDDIFTFDESVGASCWYPANDTPLDKATFTLRLTVPQPYVATGNGVLASTQTQGDKQTFTWTMDKPMTTYLAAVTVGRYESQSSTSPAGVTIRNYASPDLAALVRTAYARTGEVLDYFAIVFGPYPFAAYGIVATDAATDGAIENQTLSLFGKQYLAADPESAMWGLAHELAHQWFGDSVSVKKWNDIWLNEGFATYAGWLWIEHDQGEAAFQAEVQRSYERMAASNEPPPGSPGTKYLFSDGVYYKGALTLQALRLTVGDDAFFQILRSWTERYEYGNAETADFIALAKEKATQVPGAALDALFQAWLYGDKMPALPGTGT
jgi:aminopeptidase N